MTCTLALHHIAAADRQRAMNEFYRVLRPGGRLLVADFQPPPTGMRAVLAKVLFRHAIAENPLDQAVKLIEAAGFSTVTRDNTPVSWIGQVSGTKGQHRRSVAG